MHTIFDNATIDYSKYLKIKNYKRGELIFLEGSSCTTLGLVLKGKIQISTYTILENEFSLSTIEEDDIFASTLLFSSNPIYLGNAYALKETSIGFLEKSDFLYLLQNDINILNNYLKFLADKRLAVQERLKILSQKNIKEKILFLIKLRKGSDNKVRFSSKEKLALYLNIPRPSLSRELINLKNEGILDYDRNTITLLN